MAYNFTALENNTNFLEFFQVVNAASNEWYLIGMLLAVFIISFIMFKTYETITALRGSAFITSIVALLFWTIDLLSTKYLMFPVVILGLLVFYGLTNKE